MAEHHRSIDSMFHARSQHPDMETTHTCSKDRPAPVAHTAKTCARSCSTLCPALPSNDPRPLERRFVQTLQSTQESAGRGSATIQISKPRFLLQGKSSLALHTTLSTTKISPARKIKLGKTRKNTFISRYLFKIISHFQDISRYGIYHFLNLFLRSVLMILHTRQKGT